MDKKEFSTDSWHYKFVNKMTPYFRDLRWNEEATADICSYTRAFIKAVIKTLFLSALCIGAGGAVLSSIVYWVAKLVFHYTFVFKPFVGAAFFGTVAIAVIVGLIVVALIGNLLAYGISEIKDRRRGLPPGALKTMYRSFKEKTCVQLTFK
jgi:hypothetical protein